MASQAQDPNDVSPEAIVALENVLIRPLHITDAPASAKHGNDPGIVQWMRDTFPFPYSLKDAEGFITNRGTVDTHPVLFDTNTAEDKEGKTPKQVLINYAIVRRSDGAFMGGIGLKPRKDVERRTMEVGYWIGREFWGKGYMTEALRGFSAWTFATFPQLLRLEAKTFEGNVASGRVLLKAGYQAEGVRRKAIWKRGEALDELNFGMLRSECPELSSLSQGHAPAS